MLLFSCFLIKKINDQLLLSSKLYDSIVILLIKFERMNRIIFKSYRFLNLQALDKFIIERTIFILRIDRNLN